MSTEQGRPEVSLPLPVVLPRDHAELLGSDGVTRRRCLQSEHLLLDVRRQPGQLEELTDPDVADAVEAPRLAEGPSLLVDVFLNVEGPLQVTHDARRLRVWRGRGKALTQAATAFVEREAVQEAGIRCFPCVVIRDPDAIEAIMSVLETKDGYRVSSMLVIRRQRGTGVDFGELVTMLFPKGDPRNGLAGRFAGLLPVGAQS